MHRRLHFGCDCVLLSAKAVAGQTKMNHQIFLSHGCAVLKSASLHSGIHAHLAHQWTFSLNHEPFRLWLDGHWQHLSQVFIPSQTPHQFADQTGEFLTLLIDADCTLQYQTQLQQLLQQFFAGNIAGPKVPATVPPPIAEFLQALSTLRQISDERIRQALQLIQAADHEPDWSAAGLAAAVALSPGRFLHLFKTQTGVPLRKYLRWQKLLRVFRLLAAPNRPAFTELALQAGFYDAAHLANEIRQSFGLALSDIVHNSQFFQDESHLKTL
jgi:AraC-like DNA-binding protein